MTLELYCSHINLYNCLELPNRSIDWLILWLVRIQIKRSIYYVICVSKWCIRYEGAKLAIEKFGPRSVNKLEWMMLILRSFVAEWTKRNENKNQKNENKIVFVPIWSYLSFHLYSQYLRCPIRAQFDPAKRTQFGLQSDGIGRTSHSDCGRSILICRCAIANSKCEWFDRPTRSISMGIRDGRMSCAHSPNGPTEWRCTDVSCNSRTVEPVSIAEKWN